MATPTGLQTLTITDMGGQGDGLARAEDGRRLFAPLTLPGETVSARVDGGRAEVERLITPSPDRVDPACVHFGACGGCALQHWSPAPYLAWKRDEVRRILVAAGLEGAEVLAPLVFPPQSRRRLALHARRGPGGPVLGFKARRSWDLVEITQCPVAHPSLMRLIPRLKPIAALLLGHPKSAPTFHLSLTRTGVDVDVTGVEKRVSGRLGADARLRLAQAAAAADLARLTLDGELMFLSRTPQVAMAEVLVEPPPGAFLQAIEAAERAMADRVAALLAGRGRIADLFCGMGTFAFALARTAPVDGFDSDRRAVEALRRAAAGSVGRRPVTGVVRDLFREPVSAAELKPYDAVCLDPPRAGALAQVTEIAASALAQVAYVSCNPTSFARDARVLADGGFALSQVLPVDQFLWSPHIELVAEFRR